MSIRFMKIMASQAVPRFKTMQLFTQLSPCRSSCDAGRMSVISATLPTPVREGETGGAV